MSIVYFETIIKTNEKDTIDFSYLIGTIEVIIQNKTKKYYLSHLEKNGSFIISEINNNDEKFLTNETLFAALSDVKDWYNDFYDMCRLQYRHDISGTVYNLQLETFEIE